MTNYKMTPFPLTLVMRLKLILSSRDKSFQ